MKASRHPPVGEFTSVSAGGAHTCGLLVDGSVACWGDDYVGESSPPVGEFTSVSAGGITHAAYGRMDRSRAGAMMTMENRRLLSASSHLSARGSNTRAVCRRTDRLFAGVCRRAVLLGILFLARSHLSRKVRRRLLTRLPRKLRRRLLTPPDR